MAIFKTTVPNAAARPMGITVVDGSDPDVRELIRDAAVGSAAKGGVDGQDAKAGATVAASGSNATLPSQTAAIIATIFFLAALIGATAWFGSDGGPTFTAAEGIGAFALFYVVAQAAERLVEMVMPLSEKAVSQAGRKPKNQLVEERDAAVVAAVQAIGTAGPAAAQSKAVDDAAAKQAAVDQARADRTLISFGATAALGMLLCAYLGADFLTSVGVDFTSANDKTPGFVTRLVMMAVTGLVVGAGSKQLHDTISNISKSSDKKSTPAETGGQK